MTKAIDGSDRPQLAEIMAAHAGREGPLLPVLHDVQTAFGCIDREAEAAIAEALNLSRAEVHGVVSFYHLFRASADPRPCVQLCRAEACQARGVEALVPAAEAAAKVNGVERVRLETVYCLGLCSVGPNARVGDALRGRELRQMHAVPEEALRFTADRQEWGVSLDPDPGLRIPNMLDAALDGSFRAI